MNLVNIDIMEDGPERDRIEKLLNTLRIQRIENPLYFYNHPELNEKPPHVRQLQFHALQTKVKCFFGGNQSGKTTAGLADDIIQAVKEELLPDHLIPYKKFYPPFNCRILAPSVQVLELVIYEKLQELMPLAAYPEGSWAKSFDKQLRILRLDGGSSFQFMTYEQDVSKQGGVTIHRVHYDEEPPRAHRIENRLRVARWGGDELFTLTPLSGLSWAYDELWEARGPEGDPDKYEIEKGLWSNPESDIGVVLVDMDDNPYLTQKEQAYALAGLSEEEKQARKAGQFVHFSGLIYNDFDPSKHIVPQSNWLDENGEVKLPENKTVILGIDPGLRNRCAVLFSFTDEDDNMYIYDEIYEQGKTVQEIAEQINRLNMQYHVMPNYTVIDPAARNRNHQTGRSDQMEYADNGILTIPGQNAVEAGINRVRERLQNGKLLIFDNCVNLKKEITRYRWREAPRTGEDGKPLPLKTEDHALDALRYIVMSRPYLPHVEKKNNETELQRIMREDMERFDRNNGDDNIGM